MDEDDNLWEDLKLQSQEKKLLNECIPTQINNYFYKKF